MERIATVTIAGKDYKLSESAYKLLVDYDRFIKRTVTDKEKMLDIETQLSVLIDTDLPENSQVVDEKIIREAINIVGNNENIKYYPGHTKQRREFKKTRKKVTNSRTGNRKRSRNGNLYRNTDNGIIGGVCAGIGDNMNIDPVIIRLFYIILSFVIPFGLPIYIVLWIVLPERNNITSIFK